MIARLRLMGATAAAALLLAAAARAAPPAESKAPASPAELLQALAKAGTPGAEHEKLQPFVGNWDFTMKLWTDPSQPPAELKGTVERKWIMDGRFIQETAHGECAQTGKTFEGLGLMGYDAAQKKFTCVRACGLCGTISSDLVSCDSAGTRFECVKEETCPVTGEKTMGRNEVVIENNDRIVVNHYKTIDDREVKVAEMVSIRRK